MMKNERRLVRLGAALVAAVLACAAMALPAAAQDGVLRVGVVDLQQILRESTAAAQVHGEVEAKQNSYREEIARRESELRTRQGELERQRTILSPQAFAEREADFAVAVEQLQREVGERNRSLEETLAYGMQQVQAAALRLIARIAEEMSLDLVLDKSQLVMVATELEFSARVIEELNAELPAVSTTPPARQ